MGALKDFLFIINAVRKPSTNDIASARKNDTLTSAIISEISTVLRILRATNNTTTTVITENRTMRHVLIDILLYYTFNTDRSTPRGDLIGGSVSRKARRAAPRSEAVPTAHAVGRRAVPPPIKVAALWLELGGVERVVLGAVEVQRPLLEKIKEVYWQVECAKNMWVRACIIIVYGVYMWVCTTLKIKE